MVSDSNDRYTINALESTSMSPLLDPYLPVNRPADANYEPMKMTK